MCGIVGYIGQPTSLLKTLIGNLKMLEYRGYDSSGVAYHDHDKIRVIKKEGKIANLEASIKEDVMIDLGIAHTRWATHGQVSETNCHPHQVGSVTLVHNGIIENYLELKAILLQNGYHFQSATDTEVACAWLDYLKKQGYDNLSAIAQFQADVTGSYALGIIFDDEKDTLYATKDNSPLIVGLADDANLIASDVSAIVENTRNYVLMENFEIALLTKDRAEFYDHELHLLHKEVQTVSWDIEKRDKKGYEHFMLKEINEEGTVFRNTIDGLLQVDDFLKAMPDFTGINNIHIVGCGSAMHAGMVGKYLIESDALIPVQVDVASEYRYKQVFYDDRTLVILISQSGETADTIASLRKAKEDHIKTLGIVNVVGSTMAREVDEVLYIKAGAEIAVATTKAYLLQVLILVMIDLKIKYDRQLITKEELQEVLDHFRQAPNYIQTLLDKDEDYQKIAQAIYQDHDLFFIGRGIDYAAALEGSLKLKEISYMHSEAYQAGELKHGSIALINEGTKVIAIMNDPKIHLKTISNIKEVKARGAYVILLTTDELMSNYEFVDQAIVIKHLSTYLDPLLAIIPLQLVAYHTAVLRGCEVDTPKNLAKSVTVE